MLSDNGTEYKGTRNHPYQIYLELNDIKHRTTKVKIPQTNGFIERFNRTVLDAFFRFSFRTKQIETEEILQKEHDKWLNFYNTKRPHQRYRNMGRKPIETIINVIRNQT